MATQIINAIATIVEGQIENINFSLISDEKKYEESVMKFNTLKNQESELIMVESDAIELESGVESAEKYYNEQYSIRIEAFAPKFDTSNVEILFVNGRNVGKGEIIITITD